MLTRCLHPEGNRTRNRLTPWPNHLCLPITVNASILDFDKVLKPNQTLKHIQEVAKGERKRAYMSPWAAPQTS